MKSSSSSVSMLFVASLFVASLSVGSDSDASEISAVAGGAAASPPLPLGLGLSFSFSFSGFVWAAGASVSPPLILFGLVSPWSPASLGPSGDGEALGLFADLRPGRPVMLALAPSFPPRLVSS